MANKYDQIIAQLEGVLDTPPATPAQLDDIELRLGHLLPADYREFLQDYGDYAFYGSVAYPVMMEKYIGINTIFTFHGASSRDADVAEKYRLCLQSNTEGSLYAGISQMNGKPLEIQKEKAGWPPELLPIAIDNDGNQICLALFGLRSGAIFFWANASGEGGQHVYLIANSFDDFMHLLRSEP